jgi:hypothetical protein
MPGVAEERQDLGTTVIISSVREATGRKKSRP